MKILVLGLGNPILSDDSVGWKVAEAVRQRVVCPNVTVQETSLAGLSLLDLLVGYDRAILVDGIRTKDGQPGSVYVLAPEDFQGSPRAASPHDVSFREALELGRRLCFNLPKEIAIVAVEVEDTTTFGESCTPAVQAAIPGAVELVLEHVLPSSC